MCVENGVKSIKGLGQMQGRQTGGGGWRVATPPPPNFGRGVECLSTPTPLLILRVFFLIAHICNYYVQVIAIWGGGGGGGVGSH